MNSPILAIGPLGTPELIVVAVLVLVLLGAKKLPAFARGLGAKIGGKATSSITTAEAGDSLLIERRETTSLELARSQRDDTLALFARTFDDGGLTVRTLTFESAHEADSPWWRIEHEITPANCDIQRRATLTWVSSRHDFHRYEALGTLTVKDSRGSRSWHGIANLTEADAQTVWKYLNSDRRRLRLYPQRVRAAPWEFWRETNEVMPLERWTVGRIIGTIAFTLAIFLPPLLLLVFLGMGIYGFIMKRLHPHRFILSAGKPVKDPRALRLLANWHSNLYGLGGNAAEIFAELQHQLIQAAPEDVRIAAEPIWYYGPDGKVERTQLAISFRRVTAFTQVGGYGNDLHVGWDGHLNLGTWLESTIATGTHKDTGEPVELRSFSTGVYTANEYDYTDAAFLIEWLHSKVTQLVKQKAKEHEIDQEIDFKIVRNVANISVPSSSLQRVT